MVTTNQNKPKEFGYWEMHLKPDWELEEYSSVRQLVNRVVGQVHRTSLMGHPNILSFFGFLIEFYLFYLLITPPAGSLTLLLKTCSSDGTQNRKSDFLGRVGVRCYNRRKFSERH